MEEQEEEDKAREGSRGKVREGGAGQGRADKARPGILLCAPLGLKGLRGKVQSKIGKWYDVHVDRFRRDNILEGAGQGDQCWGGLAGTVISPENDGMDVSDCNHAHYGRQETVVGAGTAAAQGGAGE